MFVDSHAHLDDDEFKEDLDLVLGRAIEAGVERIIIPGSDLDSSRRARELAHSHVGIFFSPGIHPHSASSFSESALEELRELARHPLAVAIGETGLDYHYEYSPRDEQKESLRLHIGLAREMRKPLILHCREALEDLLRVLEGERADTIGGVVHCFPGDAGWAKRFLGIGLYLGITGVVTFPKSVKMKEVARSMPLESLLLETDAPCLAPVPRRGKRNEPAFIPMIAAEIAGLRGLSLEEVGLVTTRNARRCFGLMR